MVRTIRELSLGKRYGVVSRVCDVVGGDVNMYMSTGVR